MVPPVQASIEVPSKLVLKPANLAAAVDLPMQRVLHQNNWLQLAERIWQCVKTLYPW